MRKINRTIAAFGVVAVLMLALVGCVPREEPEARTYGCAVYTEQGCGKYIVASGGEIEVQSGGTIDIQSGATTDFSSGIDLDGGSLIIDADGDSILVEVSDDLVTFTPGAATGSLEIRTGNLQVGDGTPGETHNGEDFYVEGISEFDGSAYFDGAIDADSTSDFAGTATFSKGSGNAIVIAAGGALSTPVTADLNLGGFVRIGDGTPDGSVTAGTDEQLYVEGALEVDGEFEADGAIDADSTIDVASDATLGADLIFSAQTAVTVTQDSTITPLGVYVPIQNQTGAVSTSSIAAGTAGQLLILTNISANTITITDTGTVMLSANIALGQYDTLALLADGTNWLQLSTSNN